MIQFFVSNETSQQLSLDLILQKYVQKQLSEGSPNQMTGFYMKYNTVLKLGTGYMSFSPWVEISTRYTELKKIAIIRKISTRVHIQELRKNRKFRWLMK